MKGKIFNSKEVQVIIAGKKTMFREVVSNAIYDHYVHSYKDWHKDGCYYPIATMVDENNKRKQTQYDSKAVKPKFQVEQEIFVKETFAKWWNNSFVYKADITPEKVVSRWYLSQHMKQKQSRITLKIKSVKVERLQDISESDVMKEGCYLTEDDMGQPIFGFCKEEVDQELGYRKAQNAYKIYWNSNHKKQEQKWEANPWVFAYEFEIINLKK